MITLCQQRKDLLAASGHLLVRGGPGSGKTTIALLKAGREIAEEKLAPSQKILFLSFARATTARVAEQARAVIPHGMSASLEINTYHGFAWMLIQSYGYLVTGRRTLRLLTPPEKAARLAHLERPSHHQELQRLLAEEGIIGFDLFAEIAGDLLRRSPRLAALIGDRYPLLILDEFQDTNSEEWQMMIALGHHTRIIALADPDQRIYEFRGADPARIAEFVKEFPPKIFDFGIENNRSTGTDIVTYGNDILAGLNIGKDYQNVEISRYTYDGGEEFSALKYALLRAIKRLKEQKPDGQWSIAVLVNAKSFMLHISNYLSTKSDRIKAIHHDVLIDPEGPALAATLIAGLMEGALTVEILAANLTDDLIAHIRGRNGGEPNQQDLKLTGALTAYRTTGQIRGTTRKALLEAVKEIAAQSLTYQPTGDPQADWRAIRRLLLASPHPKLHSVGEDARFLRLLNKGALLQENLAEQWRIRGNYSGARAVVEGALRQEHFSSSTRTWRGINLMTIHKSKGKEFDEVIILEGQWQGRLLRGEAAENIPQARLTLRVGVTRAVSHTTILTPKWKPCSLL